MIIHIKQQQSVNYVSPVDHAAPPPLPPASKVSHQVSLQRRLRVRPRFVPYHPVWQWNFIACILRCMCLNKKWHSNDLLLEYIIPTSRPCSTDLQCSLVIIIIMITAEVLLLPSIQFNSSVHFAIFSGQLKKDCFKILSFCLETWNTRGSC